MPRQALAFLDQTTALTPEEPKKEKKGRISARLKEAINLIYSGECKTQKAACERMGFSPQYLSTALRKPEVRVFIEQRARQTIAAGMMRASARLIDLVDAGSEHVSLDASKHVLGIAGIKPAEQAQVSVNIDVKAGFVIDLSEERLKVINAAEHALGQSVTADD